MADVILKPWPGLTWSFADAAAKKGRRFIPSQAATRTYQRQLRSVAAQIRHIIATSPNPQTMESRLRRYADATGPWAEQAATNMTLAVARKNEQVWRTIAGQMGESLREQLKMSFNGESLQEAIRWNVNLIKNISIETADRIAGLTGEALVTGERAEEMAKKIMKLGDIADSRALAIARSEVSKANTALTKQRSLAVGSEGYIWRTAGDGDVRDSHAQMEGKFVKWSEPPTLDGITAHAGEFPNDRCYPEPVVPMAA